MFKESNNSVKNWFLVGIPVIFILGSIMHFVFDLTGRLPIVGIFTPVNESPWEHLKLSFLPMIIWWGFGYLYLRRHTALDGKLWLITLAAAQFLCPLVVITFYYTYTGAFGIESLVLDIFSFLLGVTMAQFFALHIYAVHINKYGKFKNRAMFLSIIFLLLMAVTFIVFTFNPPHLPLFMDQTTQKYGI